MKITENDRSNIVIPCNLSDVSRVGWYKILNDVNYKFAYYSGTNLVFMLGISHSWLGYKTACAYQVLPIDMQKVSIDFKTSDYE